MNRRGIIRKTAFPTNLGHFTWTAGNIKGLFWNFWQRASFFYSFWETPFSVHLMQYRVWMACHFTANANASTSQGTQQSSLPNSDWTPHSARKAGQTWCHSIEVNFSVGRIILEAKLQLNFFHLWLWLGLTATGSYRTLYFLLSLLYMFVGDSSAKGKAADRQSSRRTSEGKPESLLACYGL